MIAIQNLIQAARQAPSADNSQPWHLTWNGERLSISYDAKRVAEKTFVCRSQATLLSIGAAIENIQTQARSLSLNAVIDWIGEGDTYAHIRFESTNSPPETGIPSSEIRHTNRFAYKSTPLPKAIITGLNALETSSARQQIVEDKQQIKAISGLIRQASEIRFQTEEVHRWLGDSLRFSNDPVKNADGLEIATLGLPPGGSLVLKLIRKWERMRTLNRLGVYKFLASSDAAPVKKAPMIIAIFSNDTEQGVVEAGQLLARSWSYLNVNGIAVHPYYVIPDQLDRLREGKIPSHLTVQARALKADCAHLLTSTNQERLCMLLRVGYPKKLNPPRSSRLPLEQVYSDLSKGK